MGQAPPQNVMQKLGTWLRRGRRVDVELPLPEEASPRPARFSILRPFARRDATMQSLQRGMVSLADLMDGIRVGLERSGERQDELLRRLANLPEALASIPESGRAHGEAIRAMQRQAQAHAEQQARLAEILDRIADSSLQTRQTLEAFREHLERLGQTDQVIAERLDAVASAMQDLGRNSQAGTTVLQQMRDQMAAHDQRIEQIIRRHGLRFTVLLSIAIALSLGAIIAVIALLRG